MNNLKLFSVLILLIFLSCSENLLCKNPYGDSQFFPFPNSFCFKVKSGAGMEFLEEEIPQGLDVESLRKADGFSMATPVIFEVEDDLDPSSYSNGYTESANPANPILIVSENLDDIIPFKPWQREGDPWVVLFPLKSFKGGTRYFVVLKKSLRYKSGKTYKSPVDIESLINQYPEYEKFVENLEKTFNVNREEIAAIWDFRIRSEENASVFRNIAEGLDEFTKGITIVKIETFDALEKGVKQNIKISVLMPYFLNEEGRFELKEHPPYKVVKFLIKEPESGYEGDKIPFVLFGHGLSAVKETMEIISSDLCSAGFYLGGIDAAFHGETQKLTESLMDLFLRFDISFAGKMMDGLLQTLVWEYILAKHLKEEGTLLRDITGEERPIELFYVGQSMGSYLGTALLSAVSSFTAGVLNVGGCCIGRIFSSNNFNNAIGIERKLLKKNTKKDVAVILGLSQTILDGIEPLSYAGWVTQNVKGVILQEGINDRIVPNETTDALARKMGIYLLEPYVRKVTGVPTTPSGFNQKSSFLLTQFKVNPNIIYDILSPHVMLLEDEPREQIVNFFLSYINSDPEDDGKF